MIEISASTWDSDVISSDVPVLVDFWAEWCAPCKAITPILEDIEGYFNGKIKFVSVNIENEMGLAKKNSVLSIPTLILFVNGKSVDKFVGGAKKQTIIDKLEKYVTKNN